MKNFDIEKLERTNIYKTPDDFFDGIQDSVLKTIKNESSIEKPKSGKIFTLYGKYAAAACIALFVGTIAFFQLGEQERPHSNAVIANSQQSHLESDSSASLVEHKTIQETPSQTWPVEKEEENSFNSENSPVSKNGTNKQIASKIVEKIKADQPEVQLEQIIQEMPTAEFADLSRAAEEDIYLDLYN